MYAQDGGLNQSQDFGGFLCKGNKQKNAQEPNM